MKDAVLRLFFIALSVLLLSGLVILGLKGLGQSQQFSPLDHPLLNDFSTYYIVSQSERPLLNVEQLATAITYVTLTTKNDNWIVKSEGLKPEYYVKDLLADEKFQQLAIFVDSRINLGALVKLL
ncbi:MAG: hypothetical protein KDD40_11220, partial [Bdellovibrionales bacterium]|nr:hypothetical protein [Bdellovibrionales bacterium]